MAVLTTEKLTPTVGALVEGVDPERLVDDDTLPAWTLEALTANGALVFRGMHLDDATQVAFSKKLGKVEVFGKGEFPEIYRVTLDQTKNRSAVYLKGTFEWHIDGCLDDIPILATMLSAHAVAESGGETEFASSYAGYETLSDDMKQRVESLRVVHTMEASQRTVFDDPTPEQLELWRSRPPKEHPMVWTHQNGRKSLVLGATADHVVGMSLEEGRALLRELLDHATERERVYQHKWELGDLVIWDNHGVLHRALRYDETSPRDMHRTTFAGNERIG